MCEYYMQRRPRARSLHGNTLTHAIMQMVQDLTFAVDVRPILDCKPNIYAARLTGFCSKASAPRVYTNIVTRDASFHCVCVCGVFLET